MQARKMPKASKVEAAKYYLDCEFDNILDGDYTLKPKTEGKIFALLEALSATYRTNAVFDYVKSNDYEFEKRVSLSKLLANRQSSG